MIDPIDIIRKIELQKQTYHIEPSAALFTEVMDEVGKQVKDELNKAVTEGLLEFHRTINGISFNTTDKYGKKED